MLFRKEWYDAGILRISDIMNTELNFLTLTQLCSKYNLNQNAEIMYYNGVKSALRGITKITNVNEHINKIDVYHTILKHIIPIPIITSVRHWEYCIDPNSDDWEHIYKYGHINLFDTYTQSFQYNLVHRALPTKYKLFKMNITDNADCNFCLRSIDSIEHIYYECPITQAFYKNINVLMGKCNVVIPDITSLNKRDILLQSLLFQTFLTNFIIIVCKRVIHRSYWKMERPTIEMFKSTLFWQCDAGRHVSNYNKRNNALPVRFFDDILVNVLE